MGKPFEKIAVIGTGTLGTQIALLAKNSGYKVTIYDVREGAFKEAFERLRSNIQEKGIEPLIPWDRLEAIKTDIREVINLDEAVKETDLVVEAVPENLELKQKVFDELGRKASMEAVFATNSSSIPVSRMEESTGRPEQCLNTHFYNILEGRTWQTSWEAPEPHRMWSNAG